jgi:hypothetical protein
MTNHLAFDQSTADTGWAYRPFDSKRYTSGVIDMRKETGISEVLRVLVGARVDGIYDVMLEDVYHDPKKGIRTFRVLIETLAMFKGLALGEGFNVTTVLASVWKSDMLSQGGYLPPKRKEQKDLAVWLAQNEFGMQGKSEDEAEALCIAAWADAQRKLEG